MRPGPEAKVSVLRLTAQPPRGLDQFPAVLVDLEAVDLLAASQAVVECA